MKEIPLSQGKVALVSDEDYDHLCQYRWCAHRGGPRSSAYAVRNTGKWPHRTHTQMHRVIAERMGLEIAGLEVDHINGDGLDNRRSNLRVATAAENRRNRRRSSNNSSGYKGVSFNRHARKWAAHIGTGGAFLHLGYFVSKEDAAREYDSAARKYFGAFARTNF